MSSPRRSQFEARVASNDAICGEHFRLTLGLDQFPHTRPGQFVQIACRDLNVDYSVEAEFDWDGGPFDTRGIEFMSPLALLRRPFSLAGRRETRGGVELEIIHRVVGVGTDWMSRLRTGDSVFILGPLGNTFPLPPAGAAALLVGGGVGIPPMLYLAEALQGQKAVAFCGALTRDLLVLDIRDDGAAPLPDSVEPRLNVAEFARHGIPSVVTTDDGSFGFRGFVTQALEAYLDAPPAFVPPVVYTCGPEPMMKRVADIAGSRGLTCHVAVERAMACGMGTCQSCVIRVRKPGAAPGRDWAYRLACTDGPVFTGAELVW